MTTETTQTSSQTTIDTLAVGQVQALRAEAMQDTAHGYTFRQWLDAAGRDDSASEYDLRAAWRAGEEPADYVR